MKKYRFEIIIFIVDAICMILELVASRLLSPYFGNSNIVWTSVIGIILLSSSIGNYIGGKIADLNNKELSLKKILISTTLYVILIPFLNSFVIKTIATNINNVKIGAIFSTVMLFFFPSLCMGIVTPIIIRLKINDLENAGKSTGIINAIGTLGGIIGTFLGGFVLLPMIGSNNTLFILTILLAISIELVNFRFKDRTSIGVSIIIVFSLLAMIYFNNQNNKIGKYIENVETEEEVSYDTQYGRVLISNRIYKNENVRVLNIDGGFESATFFDVDKKYELVFDYTKYYDLMFQSKNNIDNVLMIGGAGYSYPKYYISHFPNKKMDVVEIDGKITEIAKKYFYLDQLIDDYRINENHRLNLITEDGRTYLNKCNIKYDAILNDAFSGENPVKTLTTYENILNIKKSLNENGLYLTNIISSLEGENSKFIKAEINTIKQVFKNIYVIPCQSKDVSQIQNIMVIATNDNIDYENTYDLKIEKDEIIITDDYCPVDNLIPKFENIHFKQK